MTMPEADCMERGSPAKPLTTPEPTNKSGVATSLRNFKLPENESQFWGLLVWRKFLAKCQFMYLLLEGTLLLPCPSVLFPGHKQWVAEQWNWGQRLRRKRMQWPRSSRRRRRPLCQPRLCRRWKSRPPLSTCNTGSISRHKLKLTISLEQGHFLPNLWETTCGTFLPKLRFFGKFPEFLKYSLTF